MGRFFDGQITNPIFFVIGDILVFVTGLGFGGLLAWFVLAYMLKDVHISREFKVNEDINLLKVVDDDTGKVMTFLNPRTVNQTIELLIGLIIWRFIKRGKTNYTLHKEKQATILFWVLIVILSFLLFTTVYSVFTVQQLVT